MRNRRAVKNALPIFEAFIVHEISNLNLRDQIGTFVRLMIKI